MGTLSFYIRPNYKDKKKSTICLSYSWKRDCSPFRKSLKLVIDTKAWDSKKEQVKNLSISYKYVDEYNKRISEVINIFDDLDKKYSLSYSELTLDQVKHDWEKVNQKKEVEEVKSSIYLTDYFREFIDYRKNHPIRKTGRKVSKRSIQHYETTLRGLLKFEDIQGSKLKLKDINLKFHDLFSIYLKDTEKLSSNTIGGYLKDVKTFCSYANKKGLPVTKESLSGDFFVLSEETEKIFISEEEINIVYEKDFGNNERLKKVRAWFIIGVWTGLRVSDWRKVTSMKDGFVTVKMQKTGGNVMIPIHWMIEELIKREGFPKDISDVEFNRVIKDVFEECGITQLVYGSRINKETKRKETGMFPKNKLVTSHACRRSFATNLYKSDFPSISIMQITGHKTEVNFLKYIGVTPKEHALKLKEHWDKIYKKPSC